jgi:hypothetical protein
MYDCVLGAITVETSPDREGEREGEKAARPADKEQIYSGYGEVFRSVIHFES